MKVLILYSLLDKNNRNTILEHMNSFKKYVKGVKFDYVNVINNIPQKLNKIKYDAIILHYTSLSIRFRPEESHWTTFISQLKDLKGYKIAVPQDEYDETDKLCHLIKQCNIQTVFTCFNRWQDYLKAYYPIKTGIRYIIPVLTGYIDNNGLIKLIKLQKQYKDRPIDIGYRARKLPYYFGKHGQLKYELANFFLKKLKKTNFKYDIVNTDPQSERNTLMADHWYQFLLKCKAFLGCEGGSSLMDRTGKIKNKINIYLKDHPQATFVEVENNCFQKKDYNIKCFTVSPRNFEAAMTKTLQILVEGKYNGVFKPGKHYIELKKDFSNADQVLELLKNEKYCQKIINHAYKDIVLSQKYTYSRFANMVINHIRKKTIKDILNRIIIIMMSLLISIRKFLLNMYEKSPFLRAETNW